MRVRCFVGLCIMMLACTLTKAQSQNNQFARKSPAASYVRAYNASIGSVSNLDWLLLRGMLRARLLR